MSEVGVLYRRPVIRPGEKTVANELPQTAIDGPAYRLPLADRTRHRLSAAGTGRAGAPTTK